MTMNFVKSVNVIMIFSIIGAHDNDLLYTVNLTMNCCMISAHDHEFYRTPGLNMLILIQV